MSIFQQEIVTCPHCGDHRPRDVAHSINAERSPQLREEILDGTFQRIACEACHARFEIGHPLLYIDFARSQWFSVHSGAHQPEWRTLERDAAATFDRAHRSGAPALARQLIADPRVRLVFGLDALREKLVCFDAGLDDVTLEVLKFDQLGIAVGGQLLDEHTHARLVEVGTEALTFLAGAPAAEEATVIEVAREVYDEIARGGDRWVELAATFSSGPYVDLGRLTIPSLAR